MRPGRKLLLVALGALVVLNLGVYLAFTLPRTLGLHNLDERLKKARAEVEVERQKMVALRTRFETVSANTRDTTEFYTRRVGRRDATLVPLLREIEGMARGRGMKVASQDYTFKPVKGLEVERFEVTMPVKGTYEQVVGLVEDLERSSRFVTLEEMSAKAGTDGTIEVRMLLSCYFRSPAARAGA